MTTCVVVDATVVPLSNELVQVGFDVDRAT